MHTLREYSPRFLTRHALLRCEQRAIPHSAIEAAIRWGTVDYQGRGVHRFQLSRRAIATARRVLGVDLSTQHGVTVVKAPGGRIPTVFRPNRTAAHPPAGRSAPRCGRSTPFWCR